MKSRHFGLTTLILGLALAGCKGEQKETEQKKATIRTHNLQIETPYYRESKGLSYYKSARYNESQFYDTGNEEHAIAAINHFEEYYVKVPTGENAVIALLRKAKLYHLLGQDDNARDELERLKERTDLDLFKYSKEIKHIENLIE